MAHDPIIHRLRHLSEQPLDAQVAANHLSAIAAVHPKRPWGRPVAALVVTLLLAPLVAAVAVAGGGGDVDTKVSTSEGEGTGEQDAPVDEGFSCTGPPPFAETEPTGQPGQRGADASAFAAWRAANCPDDGTDEADQGPPPAAPSVAEEDFTCTGPPPFAETEPTGQPGQRGADASAFAAWRAANCPDDTTDADGTDEADQGPPPGIVPGGAPVPAGPPGR
jgi:hypothetical protein